jgi:hypothetical protein
MHEAHASGAQWRCARRERPDDEATQVWDLSSLLFRLSERRSGLRLLDKVIVVLALVLGFGDPRQASIAQQLLIPVRAE